MHLHLHTHTFSLWDLDFYGHSNQKIWFRSLFNEDHNKEYPLKKYEYFPDCGFQSTFKNTWNDNDKSVSIEERQEQASEQ